MQSVLLLCGLPFAGKTTVARELREQLDAIVISLDAINAERGLQGGEGIAVEEWQRSHQVALARLAEALQAGQAIVVIDDTNCLRFLRDDYREVSRRFGAAAHVLLLPADEEEVTRRLRTNRDSATRNDVHDEVFAATVDRFEWPGAEESPVIWTSIADLLDRMAH
ncbi:MAG: AAA family ATPase [Thermoanaerobaculia bacterium]